MLILVPRSEQARHLEIVIFTQSSEKGGSVLIAKNPSFQATYGIFGNLCHAVYDVTTRNGDNSNSYLLLYLVFVAAW